MMRRWTAAALLLLGLSILSANAQSPPASQSALANRLEEESRLLAGGRSVTPAEVAHMEALLREIRASKNAPLISRAELILVLFRQREVSEAGTRALNESLKADSEALSASRRHERKHAIAAASFGVGIASLGVLGLSAGVNAWAYDSYAKAATSQDAAPYYTVGRASQIATIVGAVGAVGGLGLSWLLEMDPFDTSGVGPTYPQIAYPRAEMTTGEKITYLSETRSRYEAQAKKASATRGVSARFFEVGVASSVVTLVLAYLESGAYRNYAGATTSQDAAGWRTTVDTYQYLTAAFGAVAGIGLAGAAVLYLSSPSPTALERSIHMLDGEIDSLRAGQ